jgi:hypothetical protein
MVESIWWADGFTGHFPSHFDDEVGEGWLVVASQAAWDAIKSQLGPLKRRVHIERSFHNERKRLQRNMHSEQIVDR